MSCAKQTSGSFLMDFGTGRTGHGQRRRCVHCRNSSLPAAGALCEANPSRLQQTCTASACCSITSSQVDILSLRRRSKTFVRRTSSVAGSTCGCQARPAGQVRRGDRAIPQLLDMSGRFESAGMIERALAEALVGDVAARVPSPRAAGKPARPSTFASAFDELRPFPSKVYIAIGVGRAACSAPVTVVLLALAARAGQTSPEALQRRRPRPADRSFGRSIFPDPLPTSVAPRRTCVISRMSITTAISRSSIATSSSPHKLTRKGNIDEASEMASAVSVDSTRVATPGDSG